MIRSTELNPYTAGPVYRNPNPAPLLVLWFVAFGHLRACFRARKLPHSAAWLLSTVFHSRTPFKNFLIEVAELSVLCVLCLTNTELVHCLSLDSLQGSVGSDENGSSDQVENFGEIWLMCKFGQNWRFWRNFHMVLTKCLK